MAPQVEKLLTRVDRYVKRSGYAESTVSRLVFLDSKRVEALRGGSRMFPETVEAAQRRLEDLEKSVAERAS